ncbi:hypothetical protein BDR07DRAFT_1472894 [Suillus spraguei]|nr:hypothetical protein BDR07DRAFT_1472894 [Suillus spraguei]
MLPWPDSLRLPTARVPITTETFVSGILPPVACYFATAFLVLLPRTQLVRIALWAITAVLAFCAATSLDVCMEQSKLDLLNIDSLQVNSRRTRVNCYSVELVLQLFINFLAALDLAWNIRGCGWDWSLGLYHTFIWGAIHSAVRSFSPDTFGSLDGGTIFDDSLPPHLRYLRSSIIATLYAFGIYSTLRAGYELTAVPCVLLFRQHPDQWPPSFDSPWRATSPREFWSRRWHQWFRRSLIVLGGYPLSLLFGCTAFHYLVLVAIDRSSEMWRMLLPFGMMGAGMVIERAVAGNKTGGWMGWIWTMCWLMLWGNMIVDGSARAGMLGGSSVFDSATSAIQPIKRLVRMFEGYLYAS